MHYSLQDINDLEKIFRLNLINSVTGIKPANLVGTKSKSGHSNLAIISSVVHLGSNPPLIGFIMRPSEDVERHTYENIFQTQLYTINHVINSDIHASHYTSAKFDKSTSEFDACGFTEEYLDDFSIPYVIECNIKIGMRLEEVIDIKSNGTKMLIGKVQHIYLPDEVVSKDGQLNLQIAKSVGISGLNGYYELKKLGEFPYARVEDWKIYNEKH